MEKPPILLGFVFDLVLRKREKNFIYSQTVNFFLNFLQRSAMAVWSVMRPLAIAIRKLNIVLKMNVHSAQVIVLLWLLNIATSLELFRMASSEDALIAQVLHVSTAKQFLLV